MKKILIVFAAIAFLITDSMSAKVVGRVNGYPITENAANKFVRFATKGKIKKFRLLRAKDKKDVIRRLAVDSLLIGMAKKHLSSQEINQIIVNYWLTRKVKNVKIDPADIKKAYAANKKYFKDPKGNLLPFEKVKDVIAISLKQKKYVGQLMKTAKITMGKTVISSPRRLSKTKTSSKATKKTSNYNGKTTIYVVKSGNTLSGIAHKYHISTSQLRAMNGMNTNDTLRIGQKLKVPGK